jgi:uncharacterized membrane protein
MLLRTLQNSPKKLIPVAMALGMIGLSFLLIGIAWPTLSHGYTHVGNASSDFIHGLFFGIAIALEFGGFVLAAMAAAAAAKKP